MKEDKQISNLSIDSIIYSFHKGNFQILIVKHAAGLSAGKWALPGGWITYSEDVDEAAERLLKYLTGLSNVYLEQLRVFGKVNRYPSERVITLAYFSLVNYNETKISAGDEVSEAKWFTIKDIPELIFDHSDIVRIAIKRLQHIVRHEPIGFKLLPKEFTLLQLQSLYESILQVSFDKPNFRRKLTKMKLLIDTGKKQQNVSHRAANLYKFDPNMYQQLKSKGFSFDL